MPLRRGTKPADETIEDTDGHRFSKKVKPADETIEDTEGHVYRVPTGKPGEDTDGHAARIKG